MDKNVDNDANDTDEQFQIFDDGVYPDPDFFLNTPKGVTFLKGATLTASGTQQIGTQVDFIVDGTAGNMCLFLMGIQQISPGHKLRPHGWIEVIPLVQWGFFNLDAMGMFTLSFVLPNDPNLIGFTYYVQAAEGTNYIYELTNGTTNTIQ